MNPEEIEDLLHREQLQLAETRKRGIAFFVDEVLLSILLTIVLWDKFTAATTLEAIIAVTNTFVLEYMAMKILYQTFFVMQYGATIGKIMMRIQVIELRSFSLPGFNASFNRAVFRVISEMLFYLGFLWGMFDPLRRTWHDRTAQTLVVNV
jgi:uncharacterized RDD family membrane protein YckC